MFMYNGVFCILCDMVVFYVMCLIDFVQWYFGGKCFNDVFVRYQGNINVNVVLMNCCVGIMFVLMEDEIDDIVLFLCMFIDVCYVVLMFDFVVDKVCFVYMFKIGVKMVVVEY